MREMALGAKQLPEKLYLCGKNIGFRVRQSQGLDLASFSNRVFQTQFPLLKNADNVSSYTNGFCQM